MAIKGTKGGPVKGSVNHRQGVAMVIMDKQQYTDKARALLNYTNTDRTIPKDPTTKLKNKLNGILKDIKQTGGLKDSTYHKVHPTSAAPPSFMAFPKFIKLAPPKTHSV